MHHRSRPGRRLGQGASYLSFIALTVLLLEKLMIQLIKVLCEGNPANNMKVLEKLATDALIRAFLICVGLIMAAWKVSKDVPVVMQVMCILVYFLGSWECLKFMKFPLQSLCCSGTKGKHRAASVAILLLHWFNAPVWLPSFFGLSSEEWVYSLYDDLPEIANRLEKAVAETYPPREPITVPDDDNEAVEEDSMLRSVS